MSASYYGGPHQYNPAQSSTTHMNHIHGGRSRRAPRLPSYSQPKHRHPRPSRSPKVMAEVASVTSFRRDFEAARSFDLDDDELFCPFHLLSEDDVSWLFHKTGLKQFSKYMD